MPAVQPNVHKPEKAVTLGGGIWATNDKGVRQMLIELQSCGDADSSAKADSLRKSLAAAEAELLDLESRAEAARSR